MIRGGLALALALGVSAAPASENFSLNERALSWPVGAPPFCKAVNPAVAALVKQSGATAACSSLLNFSTKTNHVFSTKRVPIVTVIKTNVQLATAFSDVVVSTTTTSPRTMTASPSRTVTAVLTVTETDFYTFEFTDTVTTTSYKATALFPAATATATAWVDCGKYGSNKASSPPSTTISDPMAGDFFDCQDACHQDSTCATFAYSDGAACLLFNTTFANTYASVSTSPFIFFDRNCPDESDPLAWKRKHKRALLPSFIVPKAFATPFSSACSCLMLPKPTTVVTDTTTIGARTVTNAQIVKSTTTVRRVKTVYTTKQRLTTVLPKFPATVTNYRTTSIDAGTEIDHLVTATETGYTTISAGHTHTITLTAGSASNAAPTVSLTSLSQPASVGASLSASASASASAGAGDDNSGGDNTGNDDSNNNGGGDNNGNADGSTDGSSTH